jgi:hypothetical protein
LVISIFALVIAMSAGAYAATIAPKNSVVSSSIKNKNVKTADIKPGAVKKKSLAGNSVDGSKIVDGQVGTADIGDGQVGSADIGDGQVGLNDLSNTAKTDLNDATTLGGLTVAQIVAASGGEYLEADQTGSADIETLTPQDLVTLNLPHAGKYLISARMPVRCTYDGSNGATPNNPAPQQPFFAARAELYVDGALVESKEDSCEAEVGQIIVAPVIYWGTKTVEFSRMITATGPTTVQLKGLSSTGIVIFIPVTTGARITADASSSKIQAITVQ